MRKNAFTTNQPRIPTNTIKSRHWPIDIMRASTCRTSRENLVVMKKIWNGTTHSVYNNVRAMHPGSQLASQHTKNSDEVQKSFVLDVSATHGTYACSFATRQGNLLPSPSRTNTCRFLSGTKDTGLHTRQGYGPSCCFNNTNIGRMLLIRNVHMKETESPETSHSPLTYNVIS